MKKKETKNQEQKRQPRHFCLHRETILVLNDPALLELVGGGGTTSTITGCGQIE